MGVRGLQTFVQKDVKNGFHPISMRVEIEKFQRENGRKPIIVVDLMSLYSLVGKDPRERLCGGRFQIYRQIMYEHLFATLRAFGAELVFFVDGPVQEVKTDTWTQRREDEYRKHLDVLDKIYNNWPVDKIARTSEVGNLTSVLPSLSKIAKENGELTTSIHNECDLEIASFACQNGALAIVADDSDFLIYPGGWHYWSAMKIDFRDFSTMEYDRAALRASLGLSMAQMPLFATFGGNDIVKFDEVKHWHNQLGNYKQKFWNLADFVRPLPLNMDEEHITHVAGRVFRDNRIEEHTKKIQQSLESYNVNITQKPPITDNELLLKLIKEDKHQLYGALKGLCFNITTHFGDLRRNDLPIYTDIVLPIRRRILGIVLQHLSDPNLTRPIRWKPAHDQPFQISEERPVYPEVTVPPLEILLLKENFKEDDQWYETRFQLLFWAVSPSLDQNRFRKCNPDYLTAIFTLYLLQETKKVNPDDLDRLLITVDASVRAEINKNLPFPQRFNNRAFRLCHLFITLYNYLRAVFIFTGLRDLRRPIPFDGVYFHDLSGKWPSMSESERFPLLEKVQQYRFYANQ